MEKGLSASEASGYLQTFGENRITTQSPASALSIFLRQFPTVINAVLAIAALLALFIGEQIDGILIFIILILNALFGFIQEYRAEKALEKLKDFIKPVSRVIRDGQEAEIPTELIVPGDIVKLSEGDRIPADGILTYNTQVEIDESILTGESLPVGKIKGDSVYKGTLLIKGKTHLLVQKTGMQTKLGLIAKTLGTIEADKTPLQTRLDALGKILSVAALLGALLIIPIGLSQEKSLVSLLLLTVSVAVAAIPEGLPAVITIALAIGTHRMAKKQAIVRKMPSVETLGAVQIILTDKTGTLTQNAMRVKTYWLKSKTEFSELLKGCILGNTASLVQKSDGKSTDWDAVGDKTDGALLLFAKKHNAENRTHIIDEYVFDTDTKTITTVIEENKKNIAFVRGAPETIIAKSKLTETEKKTITHQFEIYAKEGLRVIGFAKKNLDHTENNRKRIETDLLFIGLICIYDPPRKEARHAVLEAKRAGITPIMVTGDNEFTALSIAQDVGLIEKDEDVVTGAEMKKFTDRQLKDIIVKTRVYARTTPEDKLRLVELFKKEGYIVAVTGDGVNDALALKRADVGIAMGETGTDVAKEAADIVLTNDNFSTIIHAIEEGRRIYDNILKAITYLLSGNLSEISLVVFATALGLPTPLLPTQILWINIVTDGLPALALASDTRDPDILKRKPRDPIAPILSKQRMRFVGLIGFGLSGSLLLLFYILLQTTNEVIARTITFNALIFSHLLIAFLVRGGSKFWSNRFLILATIGTAFLQIVITTLPFFQNIFHLGF